MTEHLIVSTVVLVVAMAAARFLPLTARTRYAVLLCGIAKFAVPTAMFRFVPAEVVPLPLRILGGGTNAVVAPTTASVDWIPIAWGAIALLLLTRWLLLRARTVSAALRSPAAASTRELDAVREARATMGIRVAIDAIRSPICEAPAVLRIVRPVIALPEHGCDDLTRDELRSLVLHECAHVVRHDNLAAFVQAVATSLLWFHPLVWLASRALTNAREEACDEAVADAMQDTGAYASALTKICHAVAAPRTAGASCMASAKIQERMEHLMSYETIKGKAWSHRMMLGLAVLLLGFTTIATATTDAPQTDKYALKYTVDRMASGALRFEVTVTEIATGEIVSQPRINIEPGTLGTAMSGSATSAGTERNVKIEVLGGEDGSGRVTMDVHENDRLVQHTSMQHTANDYAAGRSPRKFTGEPMSLMLKDADLRDVMKTFGALTGLEIIVAPDAQASITMNVTNVPWDELLDTMLTQHGLVAEIEGKTLRVSKEK